MRVLLSSIAILALSACGQQAVDTMTPEAPAAAAPVQAEPVKVETPAPLSEDDKLRAAANAKILERDLNRMMDWFAGEFDNMEQVYFNENLGFPQAERHGRIHHIFTPVDLPAFPGRIFYVEQYQNNDPEDVYRQRIYSFEADADENAIRLTIHVPKDASAIKGAHRDVSKLEGLTPANFTTYPGCEVFWRYGNEHYHGTMKPGACRVESKRSDKTLIITDDLQLSKNSIWIRDEAVDTDGNYIYGNKARIHHKNNRAARFTCWVSPRKFDGEYGFYNNMPIHDQGGWIRLPETEDHEAIALKIRNVDWPMGNNRPSRVLYAYRGGDEEIAVSYAWTSPDEPRLGINLRWVQASCTQGDKRITPGINLETGSGN